MHDHEKLAEMNASVMRIDKAMHVCRHEIFQAIAKYELVLKKEREKFGIEDDNDWPTKIIIL